MEQYINKDAIIAEIRKLQERYSEFQPRNTYEEGLKEGRLTGYKDALFKLDTFEVKEGKQIIIITESDGDAHIHWNCRSLVDVNALLDCAKSFIMDRQIEDVRGKGSFSDYNIEEGRYKDSFARNYKAKEVDLDAVIDAYMDKNFGEPWDGARPVGSFELATMAEYFFELGKKTAQKEE